VPKQQNPMGILMMEDGDNGDDKDYSLGDEDEEEEASNSL
jgi:hypothetical protein